MPPAARRWIGLLDTGFRSQLESSTSVLWKLGDNAALSTRKQQQSCLAPGVLKLEMELSKLDCLQKGDRVKTTRIAYLASGTEPRRVAPWWKSCCGVGAGGLRWLPLSAGAAAQQVPFQHGGSRFTVTSSLPGSLPPFLLSAVPLSSPLLRLMFPTCWRLLRNRWPRRSLKWNWWVTGLGAFHLAPLPARSVSVRGRGVRSGEKRVKVERNLGWR